MSDLRRSTTEIATNAPEQSVWTDAAFMALGREGDRLFKSADSLEGEEVVPGFSLPVADLFQKLAF